MENQTMVNLVQTILEHELLALLAGL